MGKLTCLGVPGLINGLGVKVDEAIFPKAGGAELRGSVAVEQNHMTQAAI